MTAVAAPSAPPAHPVYTLEELSRADVPIAGGKGANLGELNRSGFPVPEAFVVTAPAYAAACDATGLRDRIAARVDGVDVDDTRALEIGRAHV